MATFLVGSIVLGFVLWIVIDMRKTRKKAKYSACQGACTSCPYGKSCQEIR